jgi:D-3-phosphoglycerate dehydrogenase
MTDEGRSVQMPKRTTASRQPRILLVSELTRHENQSLKQLEGAGFSLVQAQHLSRGVEFKDLLVAFDKVWAVIAGSERYSRELLSRTADLRVIARTGVGIDSIDVDAANEAGIAVLITEDTNTEAVADFTLAMMLEATRRLILADQTVRTGGWRPTNLADDLFGATVGILGVGRIGRAVARRLRGFGCTILGADPQPDEARCAELGIHLTSLHDMLPRIDILTLHVPLLAATRHMIGQAEFALLKRGAVIVNASRGGIVDEAALVDALESGLVSAAALDVFEHEPLPPDHQLRLMSNVILTGHIAAFTRLAAEKTMEKVVTGLLDLSSGMKPAGVVNPGVLSKDLRSKLALRG